MCVCIYIFCIWTCIYTTLLPLAVAFVRRYSILELVVRLILLPLMFLLLSCNKSELNMTESIPLQNGDKKIKK